MQVGKLEAKWSQLCLLEIFSKTNLEENRHHQAVPEEQYPKYNYGPYLSQSEVCYM